MDVVNLWTLQFMMFILVGIGIVLKRTGVLPESARGFLTDLVLYFILPCNIINSFRIEFSLDILKRFAMILFIAILAAVLSYILSRILYNRRPDNKKRVMRYCTLVSNSGFLGLPIIQGIYGSEAMMYASIFIIPNRIMMWSAGTACFTENSDIKAVVKKLATNPAVIAVYIGLALMIFQSPLDKCLVFLYEIPVAGPLFNVIVSALDKCVTAAGGCTTTLSMLLIGTMVADVRPRDFLDIDAGFITVMRLLALPVIVYAGCRIAGIDHLLTCVSVVLTGMPAGSTSAMLASKYGCDYTFATKCIVVSTLFSLLTIPMWAMILG